MWPFLVLLSFPGKSVAATSYLMTPLRNCACCFHLARIVSYIYLLVMFAPVLRKTAVLVIKNVNSVTIENLIF